MTVYKQEPIIVEDTRLDRKPWLELESVLKDPVEEG
jgi:hypothetical protein